MLTCCNDNQSEAKKIDPKSSSSNIAVNTTINQDPEMDAESNYKPNFIKSEDLAKMLKKNENIYIFDVRGKISYDEGHIKGALDKGLPITPAMAMGIPKNAKIVTYCGCPHHLSSIGAEQLSQMGYTDIHVLDEGYWYWKDHNYPMAQVTNSKVTEMIVSGTLMKDNKPVVDKDIYIRHMKTGQLEATRTDAKGYYKMTSHIYNYTKNDEFKFFVENLTNPVQEFHTDKKDNENIIVNMK